jgi:hypothetical protein
MSKSEESPQPSGNHTEHFEIHVKGHLSPSWSEYFAGLKVINSQSGETILVGPIMDQAQLHGILARIRDLNLMLISVGRIESEILTNEDHNGDAQKEKSKNEWQIDSGSCC